MSLRRSILCRRYIRTSPARFRGKRSSGARGEGKRHRRPAPPYAAGPDAAQSGATSMCDVSDGLLADAGAYEVVSFDNVRDAPAGLAELAPAW